MATPAKNKNGQSANKFESDTQRIVHRHLEDPNDTISEDDIRNVRIGMSPVNDDSEDTIETTSNEIETDDAPEAPANPVGEPINPSDILK